MNAPVDTIPRGYNFAADILERNLAAGRAGKAAYIDARGSTTYGELAERAERFGHALRTLGIRREERILICLTDTIDWPVAFLGASRQASSPSRSIRCSPRTTTPTCWRTAGRGC